MSWEFAKQEAHERSDHFLFFDCSNGPALIKTDSECDRTRFCSHACASLWFMPGRFPAISCHPFLKKPGYIQWPYQTSPADVPPCPLRRTSSKLCWRYPQATRSIFAQDRCLVCFWEGLHSVGGFFPKCKIWQTNNTRKHMRIYIYIYIYIYIIHYTLYIVHHTLYIYIHIYIYIYIQ